MEFKKIQLAKNGTLNVSYVDGDSNTITLNGANIVHRDLRLAFRALIPHLALMTEQREATALVLADLQALEMSEDDYSVWKVLGVDELNLSDGENEVSVGGYRILKGGKVMRVVAPKINVSDDEVYEYCGELQLALDRVKYETREYIEQKKWGIKQAEFDFADDNPFEGVEAGDVPTVDVTKTKEKSSRKVLEAAI